MNENRLLSELRTRFASPDPSVLLGSGPDDCAHVMADGRLVSMSVDAFVEGVHFLLDATAEQVAYKSLAASVSDLAASGCRARWAMIALGLRPGLPEGWAERFADALARAAAEFGVSVIGGDTVSTRDALFVSVTVIGEPWPGGPVLRRGAKPGDALIVTGSLGGSILGRHLHPSPRQKEMRFLMEFAASRGTALSAAMDISDGLAMDLSRLCAESGVGAVVEEASVPVAPEAVRVAAERGGTPLAHALTDGEDFELLVALPASLWRAVSEYATSAAGVSVMAALATFTRIGTMRREPGMFLANTDGTETRLTPEGFEHIW